ncbi:hypothetical protein BSL82_15735 [Tardibacter chloracetimidivorans]|uniref:Uncharacterized protein n=1 Tax=Tardibacter chloracetimidivorans TaxID=1921510 RepID=A0A1L3ZY46_9SPHN|nr:hypothetical protein BSL82_15735 [Tardibacter chloracetimidivorans]
MFKIERGLPIPPKGTSRVKTMKGGKWTYPFRMMQVGDSFLLPCAIEDRTDRTMACHGAANAFKRYHGNGFKITTRVDPKGIRVWRIA